MIESTVVKEKKMVEMKEMFQSADWKQEKHVPVIDAPDRIKKRGNL